MTATDSAPVVTVDGPSGSGKGTVCQWLANKLAWHLLDSGALYRAVAWAAVQNQVDLEDIEHLVKLIEGLEIQFDTRQAGGVEVILDGEEVSNDLRSETCAKAASTIAAIPEVRKALFDRQRRFQRLPGLVADGRDMGTVVFPAAQVKIFLTASTEERAKRRYKQLNEKGISANLADLFKEIEARDLRDTSRPIAPLKPAVGSHIIDTTGMPIQGVCDRIFTLVKEAGLVPGRG